MKIVNSSEFSQSNLTYDDSDIIESVRKILKDVKDGGDKSVREYATRFDGLRDEKFQVSKEEIENAYNAVSLETLDAIKKAAENIKFFAEKQFEQLKEFQTEKSGVVIGQKVVPIERVGCYIPGGRYPLPSTALMTVIPARVAGVNEVCVFSPKISSVTIVAADIAGADKIYRIGGVQAIGAMAYGTESIGRVDKIVGPGNRYVSAAKREVYGVVGIDFIAGPSEVLIIADENANALFVAADLLAQAEHDPSARAILLTTSNDFALKVSTEVASQLDMLSTKQTAEESISKNGITVVVESLDEAVELANKIAPEHLELQTKENDRIAGNLTNYGSLFIGEYSAEVFGDYCTGTNHTLPTGGAARYAGGLSVKDYVKILTFQRIDKKSEELINTSIELAKVEGLEAHGKAAEIRRT